MEDVGQCRDSWDRARHAGSREGKRHWFRKKQILPHQCYYTAAGWIEGIASRYEESK